MKFISAEALPILCVSDFCERERERERERETPVTSFDITLKLIQDYSIYYG